MCIKFEKVSYEQFKKDVNNLYPNTFKEELIKMLYNDIKIPVRGTKGSAGYDISSPFAFDLEPGELNTITIPTGLRAQMWQDNALVIIPRSGTGFKTGVRLANSVGLIDSDYYYAENEGHIMIKLVGGFKTLKVAEGDRIAQGVFIVYQTTEDDDAQESRRGGFGSTGK